MRYLFLSGIYCTALLLLSMATNAQSHTEIKIQPYTDNHPAVLPEERPVIERAKIEVAVSDKPPVTESNENPETKVKGNRLPVSTEANETVTPPNPPGSKR